MTRILFLTSLYSSPSLPGRSPPNARIGRAMRAFADVQPVVPLPYYPAPLVRHRRDLARIVDAPALEREADGTEILHPRYMHIPKVG